MLQLLQERRNIPRRQLRFQAEITYGFCTDNVQISTQAKHDHAEHSSSFLLMSMCFAVNDRVPVPHIMNDTALRASDINAYSFLPAPDVYQRKRERMVFLVTHILSEYLDKIKHLQKHLSPRIEHEYTKQMQQQSQFVS